MFRVKAFDEIEQVGEGIHERFIIDTEKFLAKSAAKKERFDKGDF